MTESRPQAKQEIGPESQRLALEAVLRSKAFDRSEQLKHFLSYVCDRQWRGRAAELTEYSIGVDVLGRGAEFSPGEDSIVRNRAYALRKKLEEFYKSEGAAEPLRLEIPKGSYAPRFVEAEAASVPDIVPTSDRRTLIAAILGGAAIGALGMRIGLGSRLRPAPEKSMRQFWGPVLEESGKVVLCIGTPPQTFLRTLPEGDFTIPGIIPSEPLIDAWFAKQKVEHNGPRLVQVPTFNSPLWGDAAGASRVTQFLSQYGVAAEVWMDMEGESPIPEDEGVAWAFRAMTDWIRPGKRPAGGELTVGVKKNRRQ